MNRVISRIDTELKVAEETYGIRSSHATMIVLFPFIAMLIAISGLLYIWLNARMLAAE